MPYADTDFFIALMRNGDRLQDSAKEAYDRFRGSIYTSLAVAIELLIVTRRFGLSAKEAVDDLLDAAVVEGVNASTLLLAASYIDEQRLSIFDAFHAALCNNEIISSDKTYDKLGIERIEL